jgi:adenosine deaminase/aminodeoxyfutalosine deaminase
LTLPENVTIPEWIAKLPKAELHLHLEGSATPERLVALAERRGEKLGLADARARLRYSNFLGFLLVFKWVSEQLRAPADYTFLLTELLGDLRRQNVLYAEITLSAGVVLWKQQDVDAVFAALREETERTRGVEVRWIFDAVRNFGAEHVAQVAEYAMRWKDAGVIAFGIGGDEARGPAENFRATFDTVRAAGLRVTVHAGETAGPESIWAALRALGAERIGHGLAAFRDPELVAYLAEKQIPLEVCPTSNLRTGALAQQRGAAEWRRHPVADYVRRGLAVTLATDDPGLFETSLNREYTLVSSLGLTRDEILRVAETSFTAAFCEAPVKQGLLARYRAGAASLEGSG